MMLDMDRAKAVQTSSWQTGGGQSSGASVSFPDVLREAHGPQSAQDSGACRAEQAPDQGKTKTGQTGAAKNGGPEKGSADGAKKIKTGTVAQAKTEQSLLTEAQENKKFSVPGMLADFATAEKEKAEAGFSGLTAGSGGKAQNAGRASSKNTASKDSNGTGIAGIIGSAVAQGFFLHLKGQQKKKAAPAGTGTEDVSSDAVLSSAAAKAGPGTNSGQDKKTKEMSAATSLPLADASNGAGSVIFASATPPSNGGVPAGDQKDRKNAGPTGGQLQAAPKSVFPFSTPASEANPAKADGQDRGIGGTNKTGAAPEKFPGRAPADAEKNRDPGVQAADILRMKDLEAQGKEGGIKQQEDKGQNGLMGPTAKETAKQDSADNSGGQDNSRPSSQAAGLPLAGQGSSSNAVQGRFVVPHAAGDAKDMQTAIKDGVKDSGPAAAAQGLQPTDKGNSLIPGSGNSTNTNSGSVTVREQAGTAKAAPMHSEPFVVTKQADNSIEVRIEPEGLGKMDIKLYMDKGHLNAHINASESVGKEVIEGHLGDIASKLAGEGINVGSFSVSLRNRNNGGRQEFFSEGKGKSGGEAKAVQMEQAGQKPAAAGGGLLSLFA